MLEAGTLGQQSRATNDEPATIADDAELVTRARGDLAAFAPLYDRYLGPVYRYCFSCVGSKEAADDATSLVFARALIALSTCQGTSFRSWLFAIAHNVVVDVRRRGRSTISLETAAEIVDGSPRGSPEARAIAADSERIVHDLLSQLSDHQRQIVELRLAGLTGAEIAQVLGRGHGAIRVAQFRAYARLRALLAVAETRKEARDETR